LWAASPLTASDVVDRVAFAQSVEPPTVKDAAQSTGQQRRASGLKAEGKRYH